MRLIKLKETDKFLIGYGALIITGEVYRLNRDTNNTIHSRVSFEGINLLFPSTESYIAKSDSVLLCFTQEELSLASKGTNAIVRAPSQLNLDSNQHHILEDIVNDQEVKYIY